MPSRSERTASQSRFVDHPWRRAPLELAIALGIWTLFLLGLGAALDRAPAAVTASPSAPPQAAAVPSSPPIAATPEPTPAPTATPEPTPIPVPVPRRPAVSRPRAVHQAFAPVARAPRLALPPTPTPRPTPSPSAAVPSAAPPDVAESSSAVAVYKPLPALPEELRAQPLDVVAVARFHVAPDGSATVELAEPTPNARLNQLLLDSLGTWKFFPALAAGKPVASTVSFRIPIQVAMPAP